jgi:hypothetical protein
MIKVARLYWPVRDDMQSSFIFWTYCTYLHIITDWSLQCWRTPLVTIAPLLQCGLEVDRQEGCFTVVNVLL